MPSPARSTSAALRPAIALTIASTGPVTSGPLPWDQSKSVARSLIPAVRFLAPNANVDLTKSATGTRCSTGRTRSMPKWSADVLTEHSTNHRSDPIDALSAGSYVGDHVTSRQTWLWSALRGHLSHGCEKAAEFRPRPQDRRHLCKATDYLGGPIRRRASATANPRARR